MEIINVFGEDFCVYAHICDEAIIYIGAGSICRAFSANRTARWRHVTEGQSVTVRILERFTKRSEAFEREKNLILQIKPWANCTGLHEKQKTVRAIRPRRSPRRNQFRSKIICVETGIIYDKFRDVLSGMKTDRKALNAALARGGKIRGFSFEWI